MNTTNAHAHNKNSAAGKIEMHAGDLLRLSHDIHDFPETSFEETKASSWCKKLLQAHGFQITSPISGLETAFCAEIGSGELQFGIFCEYDALPQIGHACGHNIIAAAAVGAGLGLIDLVDELGIKLKIFGTPAEEGGGGKIIMLENGAFDGLAAAMMVHPWPVELTEMPCLAVSHVDVHYFGKAAHASAFPEQGRNAADAITVAQVAIGLLRQHCHDYDQVHGIVIHGGDAPNIVPEHSIAKYYIRSKNIETLQLWQKKVEDCFSAGALATGCTMKIEDKSPVYSEMISDKNLIKIYRENAENLGREFTSLENQPRASTDMANVSLSIPSIHPTLGLNSAPIVNHQAEFADYCITESADKAIIDGAKAMAHTIIDAALLPEMRNYLLQELDKHKP